MSSVYAQRAKNEGYVIALFHCFANETERGTGHVAVNPSTNYGSTFLLTEVANIFSGPFKTFAFVVSSRVTLYFCDSLFCVWQPNGLCPFSGQQH
jgi:hypothetical protein